MLCRNSRQHGRGGPATSMFSSEFTFSSIKDSGLGDLLFFSKHLLWNELLEKEGSKGDIIGPNISDISH